MNTNLDKMRRFNRNIELQVEDIELERKGKTIVHYFDTADIQGALLGIQDLYTERLGRIQFSKSKFDKGRTLIRSLLATKRLGQIRLLPPHQNELISKLKANKFKHWTRSEWKAKLLDLISQVGLSPDRFAAALETEDPEALALILKEDTQQAEKLFKVFQNLLPWHRRLGIWQREELIHFESTKVEPGMLLSSEFILLQKKFDCLPDRAKKDINNVRDAWAWSYLFELVKQFNSHSSTLVPRLYSPKSKFSLQSILATPIDGKELSQKEKDLAENLHIISSTGKLSVLRDDDYYLYKVALRPYSFSGTSAGPRQDNSKADQKLIELYHQLKKRIPSDELPEKKDELSFEAFNKLLVEGKPVGEFIEELEQLTFFKSEWLKGDLYDHTLEALNDVKEHLREVEKMQDALHHSKCQQEVNKAIAYINNKIGDEVEAFSIIPTFWKTLNDEIKNLKDRIHPAGYGVNDYYRDFGLLRYGFPREIRLKIREILDGLCSGDEDKIEAHYVKFIQDYLSARFYDRQNLKALMTATGILLALRMYTEVFDLLKERELSHFSLQIAQAEMYLHLGRKDLYYDKEDCFDKSRRIIEKLERLEADPSLETESKAEICVGLAYLYYHAWRFQDNDAQWRKVLLASDTQTDHSKRWQYLIDNATEYASKAYKLLDNTDRSQLKVYALNEYVFFLVEGGVATQMGEIKEAAQQLAEYRADSHLWQFRCDDTLARFYHRLAVQARTETEWEDHMADALSLIEEARRKSDIDQQIDGYYRMLKIYKTRGFSERKN